MPSSLGSRITAGIAVWGLLANGASADELSSRVILAKPFVFVEASIEMLAFAAAATGQKDKAACINNSYFGSPAGTRMIVDKVWQYPDNSADAVIALLLSNLCVDNQPILPPMPALWKYTHTDDIAVTEMRNGAVAIDAGLRALARRASIEKQSDAAHCIAGRMSSGELFDTVGATLRSTDPASITAATFNAVHAACGYPRDVMPGDAPAPAIPDFFGAARERLAAVRDLQSCERVMDDKERAGCVDGLFTKRNNAIVQEALDKNAEDLKAVREDEEKMRRAAWHLPDGRPIFQDDAGSWHFEDGSAVSSELSAKRVLPPH